MHVSDEMIQAGVKRATELGLLPRKDFPEDIATNAELMEEILRAALSPEAEANNHKTSNKDRKE